MAMTKNLTCPADGTAFGKQEWMKSGPRQSAKAGKAAGITAVGKNSGVHGSEESTVVALGSR